MNSIFLGLGIIASVLHGRKRIFTCAEQLEYDSHCLRCNDPSCEQEGDYIRSQSSSSYLALAERYRDASPVLKFRAMVEEWSFDQIKQAMDQEARQQQD